MSDGKRLRLSRKVEESAALPAGLDDVQALDVLAACVVAPRVPAPMGGRGAGGGAWGGACQSRQQCAGFKGEGGCGEVGVGWPCLVISVECGFTGSYGRHSSSLTPSRPPP